MLGGQGAVQQRPRPARRGDAGREALATRVDLLAHGAPSGRCDGPDRAADGPRAAVERARRVALGRARSVDDRRQREGAAAVPSGHSTQRRAHAAVIHCAAFGEHGRGHGRHGTVAAAGRRTSISTMSDSQSAIWTTLMRAVTRRRQRGEHLVAYGGRRWHATPRGRRVEHRASSACAAAERRAPPRGAARRRPRRASRPAPVGDLAEHATGGPARRAERRGELQQRGALTRGAVRPLRAADGSASSAAASTRVPRKRPSAGPHASRRTPRRQQRDQRTPAALATRVRRPGRQPIPRQRRTSRADASGR